MVMSHLTEVLGPGLEGGGGVRFKNSVLVSFLST